MDSGWQPLPSASTMTECMCFESGRAGEPGYSGRRPVSYTMQPPRYRLTLAPYGTLPTMSEIVI
jgi:hypothetical protein